MAECVAAFEDNSTYDLEGDTAMCKRFIQACRVLMERSKNETRQGTAALREEVSKYEKAEARAVDWLKANDATFAGQAATGVTFADLSEIRS